MYVQYIGSAEKLLIRCSYWIGLGILSSVGLGTGLHTFILYLVSVSVWESMGIWESMGSYSFDVL